MLRASLASCFMRHREVVLLLLLARPERNLAREPQLLCGHARPQREPPPRDRRGPPTRFGSRHRRRRCQHRRYAAGSPRAGQRSRLAEGVEYAPVTSASWIAHSPLAWLTSAPPRPRHSTPVCAWSLMRPRTLPLRTRSLGYIASTSHCRPLRTKQPFNGDRVTWRRAVGEKHRLKSAGATQYRTPTAADATPCPGRCPACTSVSHANLWTPVLIARRIPEHVAHGVSPQGETPAAPWSERASGDGVTLSRRLLVWHDKIPS